MARFILEGEWTGYTSAQRRVVHRTVVDDRFAAKVKDLRCIVYTDGTSLLVRVRKALPREKVQTSDTYGSLIREAAALGKSRVLVTELED